MLFAIITLLPAAGVVWLGRALLGQDRELAEKQLRDRLERDADALAAAITADLSPPGADRLNPTRTDSVSTDAAVWQAGERAEYEGRLHHALALYQSLARSPDRAIRAAASIRLARSFKRAGRSDDALAVYEEISSVDDVWLFGAPVSLWAVLSRVRELNERGQLEARDRAAEAARADLRRGRWPLDAATLESAWSQMAAPSTFIARWETLAGERGLSMKLTDAGARMITASGSLTRPTVSVPVSGSGVQWTLQVSSARLDSEFAAFTERRRQLSFVLALSAFVVLTGAYFVARGVRRELALAELQSTFVSAVSHEFRTPLTSMGHLIHLLRERHDLAESRRLTYYDALDQETRRLRRLVEQLLDFGRVEAGGVSYAVGRVRLSALVTDAVTRFRSRQPEVRVIEVRVSAPDPWIDVDPEAMLVVLLNLLENAAKYSAAAEPITIQVGEDAGSTRALIQVHDRGCGIPPDEQRIIFDRFVRGRLARASGVRGTGVRLALAREIVCAHRGELSVTSLPGRGSTFTVALPLSSGVGS